MSDNDAEAQEDLRIFRKLLSEAGCPEHFESSAFPTLHPFGMGICDDPQ